MQNSYDARFEKDNYGDKPNYTVTVETTNYSCYSELKRLITTVIGQYESNEYMNATEVNKPE